MRRTPPLAVGLALLSILCGCNGSPTAILLEVDTDFAVPSEVDLFAVSVTDPGGDVRTAEAVLGRGGPGLPRTLLLAHEDGPLGPFDVRVTGQLADAEVVSRDARFSFVAGQHRVLRMALLRSCLGVMCAAGETCADGGCRGVLVPESELPVYVPRETDAGGETDGGMDAGPLDAGSPDAGPLDAGPLDAGPVDAGPVDAGPVDAGPIECPPECNGGCGDGTCLITGTDSSERIDCPPGLPCRVECNSAGACPERTHCAEDGSPCEVICDGSSSCERATDCEGASPCRIQCSGNGSCGGNNNCKDSTSCSIVCSAPSSCAGRQECRAAGACTVECSGSSSCAGELRCETAACEFLCSGTNSCEAAADCIDSCSCALTCSGNSSCGGGVMCPDGCDEGDGCRGAESCNTCG